jgi:plastocyanin
MRRILLAASFVLVARVPHAAPAENGTVQGKIIAVTGPKVVAPVDVWVYLAPKAKAESAKRALPTAQIVQKKTQFQPHILVVPKGTTIEFPNNDSEDHNVFSPDPYFDLGRYAPNKTPVPTRKFDIANELDQPSDFPIYCDIHKCMWARVKVVDVPGPEYIGRVDPVGGSFALHVPPGTYDLFAWTAGSRPVHAGEFELAAGKTITLHDLHLQLANVNTEHNNKDGAPYTRLYTGCR